VTVRYLPFAALLAVAACAKPVPPAASVQPEPMDGAAAACTTTPTTLPKGEAGSVAMQVANDGGWCALRITDKDGKPFLFGLLRERPQHGRVGVYKVLDNTRIEYTPAHGFTGSDAFVVAVAPKDKSPDLLIKVAVTVEAGSASVAPAPAPVATPPATHTTTPAARSSTPARRHR